MIDRVKHFFKHMYTYIDYVRVALKDRNNKVKCYLSTGYIRRVEVLGQMIKS